MRDQGDPVSVLAEACVRCAACSTLAPNIFQVGVPVTRVVRPAVDDGERARCVVAARICPTGAIRAGSVVAAQIDDTRREDDFVEDALYYRLFDEAEKARWTMAGIAWDEIRRERVSPELIDAVRANAASELTTFTASRRFLQEFADDADFSQWITVWAYEETKHPQVLMRWLAAFGQKFDETFVMRGRWASPFMRSRIGMLATNLVSEMVASAGYVRLARRVEEPVLAKIAMHLASDEARHASSFFRYAERAIARSEQPDADRAAALRVLHIWLNEPEKMGHPVHKLQEVGALREAGFSHPLQSPALRSRICDVFTILVGRSVVPDEDLHTLARALEDGGRRGARPA